MKPTPEYFPESSLGWLDFDSAASERVGELLRAFEEPGTLDVLGLGTVRDAFSEMLSPGTSTVQYCPDSAPLLHLRALDLPAVGESAAERSVNQVRRNWSISSARTAPTKSCFN